MQVVRLKHVKSYRVGGRVYWYHRLTKERLPDDETERIARVLKINATLDGWRDDVIPGSLGDLICRYKASPEFKRLKESTRSGYNIYLALLERAVAKTTVAGIDARWLYEVRDAMADTPRAADMMLSVLSVLLNFSIARGWRSDNPARHVKKLRGSKSYEPWPESAIERFRAGANPRMVWAVELAIYTGQRQGDVLAMQWRHIERGLISVAQKKTGGAASHSDPRRACRRPRSHSARGHEHRPPRGRALLHALRVLVDLPAREAAPRPGAGSNSTVCATRPPCDLPKRVRPTVK